MDKYTAFPRKAGAVFLSCALLLCVSAGCRADQTQIESPGMPEITPSQVQPASGGYGVGSHDLPRAKSPASSREESADDTPEISAGEASTALKAGEDGPFDSVPPASPSSAEDNTPEYVARQLPEEPPAPADPGTPLRGRQSPGLEEASPPPSTRQVGGAVDAAAFEAELYRLLNEARAAAEMPPLDLNDTMRWAARVRAPEVLKSLSHTRPDGSAYYTVFDETGFAYAGKWHGENVSSMQFTTGMYDTASAAAVMFDELSKSSGHNANMLSGHFGEVGIGVCVLEEGDFVRVGSAQLFLGQ